MKILVTFALENEFAPWRKLARFKRVSADGWDKTYAAQIASAEVRVVLTGVGRFATERAMAQAFRDIPDVCVASGLAGALKSTYRLSEVLVAKSEADSSGSIEADHELVRLAQRSGARMVDNFLSSKEVVATAGEKARLGSMADAVNMEGLYVLSAARRHGVRAVSVRAISDTADSNLPLDFNAVFGETGEVSVTKLLGQLAAHPGRLPGLVRLGHDSQRAAAALANFLQKYVEAIGSEPFRNLAKADAIAL